tara:strand:- start:198 stop:374 length:177 start_codon:yes stop_codon:yes gene_type:complete
MDTELSKAIKEASISIACCLDEVGDVTQHDLEHIQKQITIIENMYALSLKRAVYQCIY